MDGYRCPACGADRGNTPRDLPCPSCDLTFAAAFEIAAGREAHEKPEPTWRERERERITRLRPLLEERERWIKILDQCDLIRHQLYALFPLERKLARHFRSFSTQISLYITGDLSSRLVNVGWKRGEKLNDLLVRARAEGAPIP